MHVSHPVKYKSRWSAILTSTVIAQGPSFIDEALNPTPNHTSAGLQNKFRRSGQGKWRVEWAGGVGR